MLLLCLTLLPFLVSTQQPDVETPGQSFLCLYYVFSVSFLCLSCICQVFVKLSGQFAPAAQKIYDLVGLVTFKLNKMQILRI